MSIIILVPFDLVTIDSEYIKMEKVKIYETDPSVNCENISENLIEVGKFYLKLSTKCKEGAATFLSNFFERPDI
jgi:hypothetical protein